MTGGGQLGHARVTKIHDPRSRWLETLHQRAQSITARHGRHLSAPPQEPKQVNASTYSSAHESLITKGPL